MTNKKTVSIFGACGRIGLPLTWIVSKTHDVYGIDLDIGLTQKMFAARKFPYVEEGLSDNTIPDWMNVFDNTKFISNSPMAIHSSTEDTVSQSDVIIVVIGTPVDAENNPRIDNIIDLFKTDIIPNLNFDKKPLIILRSTVSPGITELLCDLIETEKSAIDSDGKKSILESENFYMVFAPERVSQGHSIKETASLPQLIGAFSEDGYQKASDFFYSIGTPICLKLTPTEAEYGKLITNMYRYVNIAFANEVYMLSSYSKYPVDMHRVIETSNFLYPRMHMPLPGPNAAGPCLFKDGKLLLDSTPYGELINNAFHINEGMPGHIIDLMESLTFYNFESENSNRPKEVLILGTAFKPEMDDIRFSESFKLKKLLKKRGYNVTLYDGLVPELNAFDIRDMDFIICMTPHKHVIEFFQKDWIYMKKTTTVIDIWKKLIDYDKYDFKRGIFTIGSYHG